MGTATNRAATLLNKPLAEREYLPGAFKRNLEAITRCTCEERLLNNYRPLSALNYNVNVEAMLCVQGSRQQM